LVETIMCGNAVIRGFAPRGIVPPFRILQASLCGRRLPELRVREDLRSSARDARKLEFNLS